MSKYEDQPAFPCEEDTEYPSVVITTKHPGMSLRDYFAAKAMQASRARDSQYESWKDLAMDSYEIADAMLKAREA